MQKSVQEEIKKLSVFVYIYQEKSNDEMIIYFRVNYERFKSNHCGAKVYQNT